MVGEIIFASKDGTYIEVVGAEEGNVRCIKCAVGERVVLYRIEFPDSHMVAYTPFKAATTFDKALERERRIAEAANHL